MQLKRKSYIINGNGTVIYDRSSGISKKYFSRYRDTYKIVNTYKCPGCAQFNCRLPSGKTPFIITDKDLHFESRCLQHNYISTGHYLKIKDRYELYLTIQGATKVMHDNLFKLKDLSLETTLLITNLYNFFLSQGEYNANSKV